MAEISIRGIIEAIRFTDNNVVVYVNEPRSGYKKADGTIVEPTAWTWRCWFGAKQKASIGKYFGKGAYVGIRGDIQPFELDEQKATTNGYTVWGKVINHEAYPRNLQRERRAIRDSQMTSSGTPDLGTYMEDDF